MSVDIMEMARKINSSDGNLYLVGGAVRDKILGKEPEDLDYAVCGISVDEFLKLFPNAIVRGKDFPVFDIDGFEFALARRERKVSNGHKGFEILTDKSISIFDDLKRRDITINSMAIDVLTNELIDPLGGEKDINDKVIRATSPAFSEDPLRAYRSARFAAKLKFGIEKDTLKLMESLSDELIELSTERIFEELKKSLIAAKPSLFFKSLRDANILDVHFKEVYNLIDVPQPLKYHPEGDVFNHTMIVIDEVAKMTDVDYIVFAALVHDFGKALTPKDVLPRHIGHEERGVQLVKNLCNRLKLPKNYEKAGITACLEHMRAGIIDKMRIATMVDFFTRLNKSVLGLKGIEMIAEADSSSGLKFKFADLGEEMITSVNAKKYSKDLDYKVLNERVRNDRIAWIKEQMK